MSENEFIAEAQKRGITDKNIRETIGTYNRLKKEIPDLQYEEMLNQITKFQEDKKNEPAGTISF